MNEADRRPQPARQCSERWDVPWKGHRAVLYHASCHRRTRSWDGKCWQHHTLEYRDAQRTARA